MRRAAIVCCALIVVWALGGCGGAGGGGDSGVAPPADRGSSVHTMGPLIVETAASSNYKAISLGNGPHSIIGLCGSKITRLEYGGASGSLTGLDDPYQVIVSDDNGIGRRVIVHREQGQPAPYDPRFSPDGNSIGFLHDGRLFVCNRDGSNVRGYWFDVVLPDMGFDWLPNKVNVISAAVRDTGAVDLAMLDLRDTGQVDWLTDDDLNQYDPDVSRDGRMLAWVQGPPNGATDIHIGSLTAGELHERMVIDEDYQDGAPRWSPDGRYLVFTAMNENQTEARVCVYDTLTETTRVLTEGNVDWGPQWLSDSYNIAFTRGNGDLYMTTVDASPGDEVLVQPGWGWATDTWAPSIGRYRMLIGPAGTDWGNNNPPFGTSRMGAIVAFSKDQLISALTFSVSGGDIITIRDRTPEGDTETVVCEARAGHIHRVLRDNGPGIPKTVWELRRDEGLSPGAVLIVYNAASARVTSMIPVWEQAASASVGSGVKVEAEGDRLIISGAPMRVYDGSGKLVSGPAPTYHVVLDADTGAPL